MCYFHEYRYNGSNNTFTLNSHCVLLKTQRLSVEHVKKNNNSVRISVANFLYFVAIIKYAIMIKFTSYYVYFLKKYISNTCVCILLKPISYLVHANRTLYVNKYFFYLKTGLEMLPIRFFCIIVQETAAYLLLKLRF